MKPAAIATWKFGRGGCEKLYQELREGASALDAVEHGIRVTEEDTSVGSVGVGGTPNTAGIVELDAAIMWGPGKKYGAVAGMRDIGEAVSVARKVMEQTRHCIFVGDCAKQFAIEQGFKPRNILTPEAEARWKEWLKTREPVLSHDTVCMLGLDTDGNMCAGTSTSGIKFKMPGRVGDSPLVGCGLYCDNAVGAAAATGPGEDIMRYAMSFRIVEQMRAGATPEEACRSTVAWALSEEPRIREGSVLGVIALNANGEWGASANKEGFHVCVPSESGEVIILPVDPA